jgi:hypothetical protein
MPAGADRKRDTALLKDPLINNPFQGERERARERERERASEGENA